ncbi:MAG: hypothetical protein IJU23_12035 [Proteobacteria bacterium]|nr:hypothetical protein [Pseudomonadota bacterium]
MVSALQAFLIEASKELKKDVEVNLGGRLAEQKFIVRGLTLDEVQATRKKAIVADAAGKERQDDIEVTRQVIIAGCVEPDFRNAQFVKDAGCATPSQVIDKVLLAGEATRLAKEIMKASGLGEDINKAVEEAKN